jgi:hypothetical protein
MFETTADAIVLAGFMLMPDSGASNVMKMASSIPAAYGVNRACIGEWLMKRIIDIIANATAASATNAASTP